MTLPDFQRGMVYLFIKIMFPITSLATLAGYNRIERQFEASKGEEAASGFRMTISILMIGKLSLLVVSIVLCKFCLMDEPQVKEAIALHKETMRISFPRQISILVTDKNFLLLVFPPLLSISLISASDNHLYDLLEAFKYSEVRTHAYFFLAKIIID